MRYTAPGQRENAHERDDHCKTWRALLSRACGDDPTPSGGGCTWSKDVSKLDSLLLVRSYSSEPRRSRSRGCATAARIRRCATFLRHTTPCTRQLAPPSGPVTTRFTYSVERLAHVKAECLKATRSGNKSPSSEELLR